MDRTLSRIFSATLILFVFVSCKEESRDVPEYREEYLQEVAENRDLVGTVRAQEELSEFADALNETRKMSVKYETDIYTVFAPNNEAFSLEGYSPENGPGNLSELVNYHFVGEKLTLDDLKKRVRENEEPYNVVTMTAGKKLEITLEGDKIALTDGRGNTAYILRSIDAINGIVYVIDNMLFPEQRGMN